MTRTYGEVLKLQHALTWLGNQPIGDKVKAQAYNALNVRLQLATEAYKPLVTAIQATQKEIFARYETLSGEEIKNLDNGNVSFGAKLDRQYARETDALLDTIAEDEPKRRAFKVIDFNAVGMAIPQVIMDEMGSLLEKPSNVDADAIEDEGTADVDETG